MRFPSAWRFPSAPATGSRAYDLAGTVTVTRDWSAIDMAGDRAGMSRTGHAERRIDACRIRSTVWIFRQA